MLGTDDQKLQIQQATDLVRLIGEQVSLRPKGREFAGLCPFHEDHNPSMYVSPVKQIYKCFVCGAGGDAFSFVMNYHKMSFGEALRYLADRAGIELVRRSQPDEGRSDRQRLLEANGQAVDFYRAQLRNPQVGQLAREYIQRRRISPEMVQQFQLGYAPDAWEALCSAVRDRRWDQQAFEQAGLISARSGSGGHYDRLRHRLIFPILDELGRPIAFGGRKLREEDEPKYLNSPETLLFNKSATLYGLHQAKGAILATRTAVIVEGYTDVIACHQAGVRNVVATLGTALTPHHVAMLRRFAQKVILIFDADEAGQKAADRAVEIFLTETLDVSVTVLPDELDPAELFEQSDGHALWEQALAASADALEYQFRRMRRQFEGADTVTGRQQVIEQYLRRLTDLGFEKVSVIRRSMVLQRLSEMLGLSPREIESALPRSSRPAAAARRTNDDLMPAGRVGGETNTGQNSLEEGVLAALGVPRMRAVQTAERHVTGALLCQPELFHQVLPDGRTLDEALTPAEMFTPLARQLYDRIYALLEAQSPVTLASFLAECAVSGGQGLCDEATTAEAEVSQAAGESPDKLVEILTGAAGAILSAHRELEYRRAKAAACFDPKSTELENDLGRQALQARRSLEHLRDNPSPVRIFRPGT